MCVFHVNGPNRLEAKSIGIGLKSNVYYIVEHRSDICYGLNDNYTTIYNLLYKHHGRVLIGA